MADDQRSLIQRFNDNFSPFNLLGRAFNAVTDTVRDIEDVTGLGQAKYDFRYRVFPEDLASDYNGHYMVININVPVRGIVDATATPRGAYYNAVGPTGSNFTSTPLRNEFSKVDNLRFGNAEPISGETAGAARRELYSMKRATRRIAESIALHMPTPVIYGSLNQYEEISLTSLAGQVGKLGAGFVGTAVGAATNRSINGGLAAGAAATRFLDAAGNVVRQGAALAGNPINPRIEVLFATTAQRQFVFEVLMAPRNEKESLTMKRIIETIRFHAAPEVDTLAGIIPTFIPPAEFDITFYNKGKENTNIPRINTCVLERIDIDYAPQGVYATFRNGHPVAARLSMAFREVEIIHKRRIVQGF
jgi:hypothetical protein